MSAFQGGGELAGFGQCKIVASVWRLLKCIPVRPRGLNITSNEQWKIGCRNVEYVDIKTIGHRKCKMFARILVIGNKKM